MLLVLLFHGVAEESSHKFRPVFLSVCVFHVFAPEVAGDGKFFEQGADCILKQITEKQITEKTPPGRNFERARLLAAS